jgi:hypothetical protein
MYHDSIMVHPLFYVREQAEEERKIKVTESGWASAGKGFMPFLKQCSTYFSLSGGGVFHIGWDIF